MPETQTCPMCGRTWEYTHTRSKCPRCDVKTVGGVVVRGPAFAPKEHVEIEREFSNLRNRLKGGVR